MANWPWVLLFLSALSSATVLPGSSEVVLATMWWQGFNPWWLWLVATSGNLLGSCFNWWLGGQLLRFQHKRWFPVSAEQLERAQGWFQRWGPMSLLMCWLPVVGDPLTIMAGVLKMRPWLFLLLVTIAKGSRYALLLLLAEHLLPAP